MARRRRGAGDKLAWNKFLNPATDGAVLPILHLNGYKIGEPDDSGTHSSCGARRPDARATDTNVHAGGR